MSNKEYLSRYKKNVVVDLEKGIVSNSQGQIEYYIEFNETEDYIIYRGTEGEIREYYRSGENGVELLEEKSKNRVELYKQLYKNWNYYD